MTTTATAGAVSAQQEVVEAGGVRSGRLADVLLLGAALLLAALLRLPFIDAQSFWLDETLTVNTVAAPRLGDALAAIPGTESAPVLYFLLAWAWVQPFGVSEASLHALSSLFGIATVAAAWGVGREVGGRTAAAVAALLCAVHPAAVWWSLDARPYALGTLLAALTVLAALRTRRPGRAGSSGSPCCPCSSSSAAP
jgi:mannosyltransferase